MMAMGTFEAGGVIGTVLAGVLADFVMKKFPHLKSYARLPIFIGSCLLAMVLLHLLRDSQPNHTVIHCVVSLLSFLLCLNYIFCSFDLIIFAV
jgi:sugar phosphate permease